MNPNLNFGQVVRGPDASGQEGTFTGILDLRGVVKIVNAVLILRGTESSDWTYDRDQGLLQWSKTYANWLGSAPVATKAASRPNNHGTFFYSQFVSVQILQGDLSGARASLDYYFTHQFKDQIAKSGEQPFEVSKTGNGGYFADIRTGCTNTPIPLPMLQSRGDDCRSSLILRKSYQMILILRTDKCQAWRPTGSELLDDKIRIRDHYSRRTRLHHEVEPQDGEN